MSKKSANPDLFTNIINILLIMQALTYPFAVTAYLHSGRDAMLPGMPSTLIYGAIGLLNVVLLIVYFIHFGEKKLRANSIKLSKLTLVLIATNILLFLLWLILSNLGLF